MTASSERRFEATVDRMLDDRVVLDTTLFYPEGGGQPADHGTLSVERGDGDEKDGADATDRWRVVDVQKRDTVHHHLEPAAGTTGMPSEGATLVGELDWERRWAHMRYHTAQHLLSALLLDEFDAKTVGNQLSTEYARLDAAYERFDDEDLALVERRMNELVDDARPVEWYTMDRETAEATLDTERTRIDLLPESITELRIVEVGGDAEGDDPFDRTACAGTHVSTTSDVGTVRVTGRTTQGRERERITFELD
nr:alanyl-tRNA editing protein [Halomarina oriensis]